jgi:cobalt-zinc-cadmium efflux system outer membrane protein
MRSRIVVSAASLAALFSALLVARAEEPLTLEKALDLAATSSPALVAAGHALEAARADESQASRWPNPELEYEIENFGGTGPFRGSDGVDQTVALSQDIEIGGKRAGRRALAAAELSRAETGREAAFASLRVETAAAYRRAQLAAARANIAAEQFRLAEQFDATVRARVDAGKAARLEALGAVAARSSAQAFAQRAQRSRRSAWLELASLLGLESEAERTLDPVIALPRTLPPLERFERLADESPSRRLDLAGVEVMRGEARLAAAERVPDPSLFAGFRRFEESGDSAWVAGFSVPLPVFDTKRGARDAADARAREASAAASESRRAMRSELASSYESLQIALADVALLEEQVIPAAEEAYALVSEGYRAGKLSYFDVINASRTLAESQLQGLDVIEEGLESLASLELQIGRLLRDGHEETP